MWRWQTLPSSTLGSVVNNVDVAVQQDADAIREALYRQSFGWCAGWNACTRLEKATA